MYGRFGLVSSQHLELKGFILHGNFCLAHNRGVRVKVRVYITHNMQYIAHSMKCQYVWSTTTLSTVITIEYRTRAHWKHM